VVLINDIFRKPIILFVLKRKKCDILLLVDYLPAQDVLEKKTEK